MARMSSKVFAKLRAYSKSLYALRGLALCIFLLFVLLNVYGIVSVRGWEALTLKRFAHSTAASATWAILPCLILAFVCNPLINKCLRILCYTVASLIFITESYIISVYQSLFSDGIVLTIMETNVNEGFEFIKSLNFPISLILCLCCLLLTIYGSLRLKRVETRPVARKLFLALCLLFTALYKPYVYDDIGAYTQEDYEPSYDRMSPVERIYYAVLTYSNDVKKMQELFSKISTQEPLRLMKHRDLGEHSVILIQGESLNRNYMSCYGYPLKTSPKIDSLVRRGELFLFDSVRSPSSNTTRSLTKVYSLCLNDSKPYKSWYELPILFDILNQAGYYTHWLSNQESTGLWVNSIVAISRLCKSQNYIRRATSGDWSAKANHDEALLPQLAHREDFKADKFFELIHLMGNHQEFAQRYPKDFEHFSSSDIKDSFLSDDHKESKAEYLNSVLYNDYIISEIIKVYSQEKAIIIYFSDHGLIVYDDYDERNFCGHALRKGGIEIPFIIYLSPKMKQAYPELEDLIRKAQRKVFMTDAFPESLLGLLGIELIDYPRSETNLFSPNYNENR